MEYDELVVAQPRFVSSNCLIEVAGAMGRRCDGNGKARDWQWRADWSWTNLATEAELQQWRVRVTKSRNRARRKQQQYRDVPPILSVKDRMGDTSWIVAKLNRVNAQWAKQNTSRNRESTRRM
jgi:hypothetical protein